MPKSIYDFDYMGSVIIFLPPIRTSFLSFAYQKIFPAVVLCCLKKKKNFQVAILCGLSPNYILYFYFETKKQSTESGKTLFMEPKRKASHQQQTSLGSGCSVGIGFRYRVGIRVRGTKSLWVNTFFPCFQGTQHKWEMSYYGDHLESTLICLYIWGK